MSQTQLDTSKVSFVTINDGNDGQRLDNFLLSILKGVPKALIYRVIRKGEVRINKKRAKADTRVAEGDIVRIPPMRIAQRDEAPPVSSVLQGILDNAIIHEDDGLLVVNKPSGLAVHGGSGVNLGLIEALRQMRPAHTFLELVHRLDRDTSGLILVAKKRSVLTALQRMLANKSGISKRYLAMVHGGWNRKTRDIKVPLLRIERQSGERMVVVDDEGKKAHTRTRLISAGAHYSLIEAEPVTGRTHQIRVHCQYEGHVIAGDQKYRDKVLVEIDKKQGVHRLFLHAWQLEFRHPLSGDFLKLEALPDNDFQKALEKGGCPLEV
ncbi:RluA family pseudouridine synthase [Bacterioplanoides sp.]|uniref:RluA family pseudouridine synthase n=1 Tax=Bacterioplanoides sp. TaxID=2066072 RepID=UPI003B594CD3